MTDEIDVRSVGAVRRPEETRVDDRALEAGFYEDIGHLLRVRIDREVAQAHDELVEVDRRLTRLDRIGLRARCVLRRDHSLRQRCGLGGLRVVLTAARHERDQRERYEEWEGEPHGRSILRSAAAVHKLTALASVLAATSYTASAGVAETVRRACLKSRCPFAGRVGSTPTPGT